MNVVVCVEPGRLLGERRPIPSRAADEALIAVRRVGVCGTDMHIFRGVQPFVSYPRVMGHELAGEIVEAPRRSGLAPGDRVCVMPYFSCGRCASCQKGRGNCCMRMQVLGVHRDGAFAEYIAVPVQFVLKADGVSLDQAAMVEFLAIGAHAVARAAPKAGERVLVVGAGPIGMAVLLFAKRRGAVVTALDTRADRLAFCRAALGGDQVVAAGDEAERALADMSGGDGFDIVFDASGNASAMAKGFDYVAHAGTYALVSVVPQSIAFSDPEFHKREMTLLGCRNATMEDFRLVLDCIREGVAPTAAFNTHRATLADLPGVFPTWVDPGAQTIKALVDV